MLYRLLADAVLFVHLAFILWVIAGALSVWRWFRLAWLHLPAVAWAVYIEISGAICPLTPLENWFRQMSGEAGYGTGFIENYLLCVIYPEALTQELQILLGLCVLVFNFAAYSWLWLVARRGRR